MDQLMGFAKFAWKHRKYPRIPMIPVLIPDETGNSVVSPMII
jgi:hypothetical protein